MLRPTILAFTVVMAFAGLARAEAVPASLTVAHNDLDLTTDDGAKAMLNRLASAAPRACKQPMGTPAHRQCAAQSLAKAVAELNAPLVTRLYLASTR